MFFNNCSCWFCSKTVFVVCVALLTSVLSVHARSLVVLQYHHVSTETPKSTSTSPALFERHLELIEQHKYKVISIEVLADALRNDKALPDKTVVITFDDGYRSIFDTAYPMLKKRDWPFTVFVNTQAHDEHQSSHMSWDELKTLSDNKVTIANHSHSHAFLIRAANVKPEQVYVDEIKKAEQRIEEKLGISYKLFAYPYGEYNLELVSLLKRDGYLAFGQHSGAVADDVNQQLIPRFPFGGTYGGESDFLQKLRSMAVNGMAASTHDSSGDDIRHPVLPFAEQRPVWRLRLPEGMSPEGFNCFASGQGQATIEIEGSVLKVQAKKTLPLGRSRYNCTALSQPSRFYWHSQLWIRLQGDGSWLAE